MYREMYHCFVSVLHNNLLVYKNQTHILLMQTFTMSPIFLNALTDEIDSENDIFLSQQYQPKCNGYV